MRISDWSSDVCSSDLQSISRLRARLHLLLRTPQPRLSRPVAGPRFRDQAVLQAECCGAARCRAAQAWLPVFDDFARRQYRSLPADRARAEDHAQSRSEEHTSELQSLMRTSYAVLCLKQKINTKSH